MHDLISNIIMFLTLVTFIFWICDKYNFCLCKKNYFFMRNNNINKFISSFFYTFLVIFIVKSFFYESFKIRSSSMFPTLIDGDFIIVEKFCYGIKDPIFNINILNYKQPKHGDIIIFRYPRNKKIFFVKRIAAIPGDIIKYNSINNKIFIYRKYLNKNKKHITKILFYKIIKNNINEKKYIKHVFENLCFNKKILLYKKFSKNKKNFMYILCVPKNNYFVLGDNLKNSLDSRFWGFVPEKNVIGKVRMIWMNITNTKKNYFCNIMFNRIGTTF